MLSFLFVLSRPFERRSLFFSILCRRGVPSQQFRSGPDRAHSGYAQALSLGSARNNPGLCLGDETTFRPGPGQAPTGPRHLTQIAARGSSGSARALPYLHRAQPRECTGIQHVKCLGPDRALPERLHHDNGLSPKIIGLCPNTPRASSGSAQGRHGY